MKYSFLMNGYTWQVYTILTNFIKIVFTDTYPPPIPFFLTTEFFQIHIQIIELRRSWFPTCFGIMYKFNRVITHTHTQNRLSITMLRAWDKENKKKKSLILHKIKSNVKSNSFKYQYFMSDSAVQIENLVSFAL